MMAIFYNSCMMSFECIDPGYLFFVHCLPNGIPMKRNIFLMAAAAFFLVVAFYGCDRSAKGKGGSPAPDHAGSGGAGSAVASTPGLVAQLHEAALAGDLKGVERALESGADVNAMEEEGRTALMLAAFNGHAGVVLTLLDAGAGIDRRDLMGRTALLYAATGPFPETVTILLDRGAEPNIVDSEEHFSPLMHAAAEGNLEVVKILLEGGSDPALKDVDGDNAASFARQAGHDEVARYIDSLR